VPPPFTADAFLVLTAFFGISAILVFFFLSDMANLDEWREHRDSIRNCSLPVTGKAGLVPR
jgi:hypothetical protein